MREELEAGEGMRGGGLIGEAPGALEPGEPWRRMRYDSSLHIYPEQGVRLKNEG